MREDETYKRGLVSRCTYDMVCQVSSLPIDDRLTLLNNWIGLFISTLLQGGNRVSELDCTDDQAIRVRGNHGSPPPPHEAARDSARQLSAHWRELGTWAGTRRTHW